MATREPIICIVVGRELTQCYGSDHYCGSMNQFDKVEVSKYFCSFVY